ncbi:MAG: xanthine dehydrogenase family protein molybdopterin-binding subunit, partial [Terriglobia bacterium]
MTLKRPGDFRIVNHSLPRADGFAKVTGRAVYSSDIVLEGMAYAKVLRSPVAHARIVRMDSSAAAKQPGVIAVVKGDDLGGINPWYGHALRDHPILAIGKVRFIGEPVAAVVACNELSAHEALESITVEYDELPAVLDADTALAEGAPFVHEAVYKEGEFRGLEDQGAVRPSNICQEVHLAWGDVEAAFANASDVLEDEYYFPMAYAYAMEAYVSVADYQMDALTVYSSAQHPFMVRHDLASIFSLPLSKVRVIVPFVGGGYGSKSYTKIEPLAAVCSWKSGRPVKLQLSIQEAFLTTRGDDARVRIKTAVDSQGLLLARQATIHLNTGAYAENSPLVCKKAANRIIGPYRIPNVKVDAYAVYTNTVPASSYRGFGAAQATFPAESQMEEMAKKLHRDPIEFRLANLARRGETIHPGYRPIDADVPGDVQLIAKSLNMNEPLPAGHGRAVGCSASDAGAFPVTTVAVRVCGDGSVIVLSGSTELGQGSYSVLAQIAAEEMGIPLEQVQLVTSDTSVTPFERSTGASRTTTLMGRAVLEACQEAISQMVIMAAEVLQTEPGALAK